jgi:hypothetical protein
MIAAVLSLVTGGSSVFSLFYGDSIIFEFIAGPIVFCLYNAMGHERARRLRFVFMALAVLAVGSIPWPDFLFAIPPNVWGATRELPIGKSVAWNAALPADPKDRPRCADTSDCYPVQ